jgi:flagellar basal-body rod protein FlgC
VACDVYVCAGPFVLNSMFIAVSGMQAAMTRLGVSASNIANANTTGGLPGPSGEVSGAAAYTPLRVIQSALVLGGGAGGGTVASVQAVQQAYVESYEPTSPHADGNGMVAAPNIDLAQEVLDQTEAALSFKLNAKVFETASDMLKTLIEMTDHARERDRA